MLMVMSLPTVKSDNISDADCSSDEDDTDYVTNISIETDLTELGSVLVFCV